MAKKLSAHDGAHKYRKTKLSRGTGTIIYRCVLPDCSHYTYPHLIKGKKSICWRCGNEFVIEREHERMGKPHCSNCIIRRGKVTLRDNEIDDLLDVLSPYEVD